MEYLVEDNKFKIKYGGDLSEIYVRTLIESLTQVTYIIQDVNQYLQSDRKIEIKVKALEKGSFSVNLEILDKVASIAVSLFTVDNINLVASLISILAGLIGLVKFLKGRQPKRIETKDDKTIITNIDGDVKVFETRIYNIYKDVPKVKSALSNNFDAINNDPLITSFEIADSNDHSLVKIEKEDFSDLTRLSEEIENEDRTLIEAATLTIIRLSFEETLTWDFYRQGYKITAKIKDPNFYASINRGEQFAKGDTLKVELQINQKWEEGVNTFVNKSYQINKIEKHLKRGEQSEFKFEE
jgi:hypothetical protein